MTGLKLKRYIKKYPISCIIASNENVMNLST